MWVDCLQLILSLREDDNGDGDEESDGDGDERWWVWAVRLGRRSGSSSSSEDVTVTVTVQHQSSQRHQATQSPHQSTALAASLHHQNICQEEFYFPLVISPCEGVTSDQYRRQRGLQAVGGIIKK